MERVLLVGANLNNGEDYLTSLEELGALAQACDMEVAGATSQTLDAVHKAFYIGTGKVDEVKQMAQELCADVIIFDNSLSPMQMRNLQERLEKPILDRSALILDIFARRARSWKQNCRWRWQGCNICCRDWLGFMRHYPVRAAPAAL